MNLTNSSKQLPHSSVLNRITVSKVFYDLARDEFPAVFKNKTYAALFWYLLFGCWHDKDSARLLLPSGLLSSFEGRSQSNSQAEAFLNRFERILPPDATIEWSGYDPRKKKCRQLLEFNLGKFERIIALERAQEWHDGGRVYLDGSRFSATRQRSIRKKEQRECFEAVCQCSEQQFIRNYLNSLPVHLFTEAIKNNFANAKAVASALPNEIVSEEQCRQLDHIKSQPLPLYFGGNNTVRLFTRVSIATLQRNVRKALTHGWTEADLRHSQLAICSRLWNIEEVEEFLKGDGNFWAIVFGDIGIAPKDIEGIKPILKRRLYSICYGMEIKSIRGLGAYSLVCNGYDKNIINRFISHPLIQAVFREREIEAAKITSAGGCFDAYKRWVSVEGERQPRDIMAAVAQSWEMRLMYPAFLLASQTRDFTITLFQHDGFSVNFRRRKEAWQSRIQEQVLKRVGEYKIQTGLEWTDI